MLSFLTAFILPLLSNLPGQIGDYFKGQQELAKLKQQAELELQKANIQLSGELAKARLEYQKESLKATGRGFKYFTFVMWFGPYMLQIVYPPLGKQIFENMAGMPEWYGQACVAIMFTVWGISVSAPVVSSIFEGLEQFFRDKRILKAAVSQNVDNEALFEVIRSMTPNRQLSQRQVDAVNNILNKKVEIDG